MMLVNRGVSSIYSEGASGKLVQEILFLSLLEFGSIIADGCSAVFHSDLVHGVAAGLVEI